MTGFYCILEALKPNVSPATSAHGFRRPRRRVCDADRDRDQGLARVRAQGRQRGHVEELPVQGGPHANCRWHGALKGTDTEWVAKSIG